MNVETLFLLLAMAAAIFTAAAFVWRLRIFTALPRPIDRSYPKGNVHSGLVYAYTLGMAPWAKESTRRHFIAYVRGIGFHAAIFLGLALLLISPWFAQLPIGLRSILVLCTAIGTALGLAGFVMRLVEHTLKALSTRDDYFAVLIVSAFLFAATLALIDPALTWLYWCASAIVFVYAPLGKIRHCIYFAYSRWFFGKAIGSHAVLPHHQQVR